MRSRDAILALSRAFADRNRDRPTILLQASACTEACTGACTDVRKCQRRIRLTQLPRRLCLRGLLSRVRSVIETTRATTRPSFVSRATLPPVASFTLFRFLSLFGCTNKSRAPPDARRDEARLPHSAISRPIKLAAALSPARSALSPRDFNLCLPPPFLCRSRGKTIFNI